MKKIVQFIDTNILRYGVAFTLLFTALYPKLPSVGIPHTWVYIRLEDFVILGLAIIWAIQLLRRKVALPLPEGYALVGYWIVGFISLVYCLLFVVPHLSIEFFPKIAALQYLRRIEYMILFFIAFSSVQKRKDLIFYLVTLAVTVSLVTIYGFGQKFYVVIWNFFPAFFQQNQFCFPAFLTGNEEFAKGIPLCLDSLSRITSTFGGHYDLAAYIVFVVPIFVALFIGVKKWYIRVFLAILVLLTLELLNFTSSRTSFAAYLVGVTGMLLVWKKKVWIIPVLLVSVSVLFFLSTATLQRFAKTIQPVQVLQVQPGATVNDQQIEKIIAKTKEKEANKTPQTPPPGTVTVGNIHDNGLASGSAGTGTVLTNNDLDALKRENIDISTESGSFLLKKAYALDISFTTRFQAEWPRDWNAFVSSPVFGTGYSSLTLASDNDYLRALGETGLTGFFAFLMIFVVLGIALKKVTATMPDGIDKAFLFGLAGGVMGLLMNALLIDVFEASKVAEPLWILLGVGMGVAKLHQKKPINYRKGLFSFFTSHVMLFLALFLAICMTFIGSISNFFVADDFTWLRWAASATITDLPNYFIHSQGFFYRPLDKVIVYFLYSIFSFQPEGYHLFILLVHFLATVGVYAVAKSISKRKVIGFFSALLFALHPAHSENIFWFSTISVDLGAMFILFALFAFLQFREKRSFIAYWIAVILSAFALITYEIAVVVPLLLFVVDYLLQLKKSRRQLSFYITYIPFVLLVGLYFIMRFVSQAFTSGGDYSYHLARLVPNVIGNFIGYIGMFLGGLPFISFYTMIRDSLRSQWLSFSMIIIVFIGLIFWIVWRYRQLMMASLRNRFFSIIIGCLVFAFVALLPFLPLGNIAPRYLYLASAPLSLAFVLALAYMLERVVKKKTALVVGVALIVIILGSSYYVSNANQQKRWLHAGIVTRQTLFSFRKNYTGFNPQTNLSFVNTPVTLGGVWVFPVGLQDGLWFIYRDHMPQVHQVGTFEDALTAISKSNYNESYIFNFDKDGTIHEVK